MNTDNEQTPLLGSSSEPVPESRIHQFAAFFQPFSTEALKLLPARGLGMRKKSKRADRIPDTVGDSYYTTDDPTVVLRIPNKIERPVKVEAKVWFANERTHNAYLGLGVLLSTIATGLLYGARDSSAKYFACVYAAISIGILIYGTYVYEKRVTMISRRTGDFDMMIGPVLISGCLFLALLTNFIYRFQEAGQATGSNPLSLINAWTQAGIRSTWIG